MKPRLRLESAADVGVPHSILNQDMLSEHFEVVSNTTKHAWDVRFTTPSPSLHHKAVIVYMEPPLGPGYLEPHMRPGKYKAVFTFNPHLPNQYPITEDPVAFPHNPHLDFNYPRRADLTLKTRRVYYAGARTTPESKYPDVAARTNLYPVRTRLVENLMRLNVPITAYGRGWGENTRLTGDFQSNKRKEVEHCGAEFMLCLENSKLQNYITEKFHNGFQSDRLVLYLGEPNIAKRVPQDAFINLWHYWDSYRNDFDYQGISDLILKIDQTAYTRIIHAARKWREESKLVERWQRQRDLLTSRIIKILKT